MSGLRLIVGLGNPGREYEHTRHNLGFLAVRRLAQEIGLKFKPSALIGGLIAETPPGDDAVCLLMPTGYMNRSGVSVGRLAARKNLSSTDILVICDDFHLDFGRLRLRSKGSGGGHNGLNSVIEHLDTDQFARLRMGIGRPPAGEGSVDYVLERFKSTEMGRLDRFCEDAMSCALVWLRDGIKAAMAIYNKKD